MPNTHQLDVLYGKIEKELGYVPGGWTGNRSWFGQDQLTMVAQRWMSMHGKKVDVGVIKAYGSQEDFAEVLLRHDGPDAPFGDVLWVHYKEGDLYWQGMDSLPHTWKSWEANRVKLADARCSSGDNPPDQGRPEPTDGGTTKTGTADPPSKTPNPTDPTEREKKRHQEAFDKLPKSMCVYQGLKGRIWIYSRDTGYQEDPFGCMSTFRDHIWDHWMIVDHWRCKLFRTALNETSAELVKGTGNGAMATFGIVAFHRDNRKYGKNISKSYYKQVGTYLNCKQVKTGRIYDHDWLYWLWEERKWQDAHHWPQCKGPFCADLPPPAAASLKVDGGDGYDDLDGDDDMNGYDEGDEGGEVESDDDGLDYVGRHNFYIGA